MDTNTRSRCAVCGKNIERLEKLQSGKEEYHLCSKQCKVDFLTHPEKFEKTWFYFRKHGVEKETIVCALCGDTVPEEIAVYKEHYDEIQSKHLFFCCENHRIEFISSNSDFFDVWKKKKSL